MKIRGFTHMKFFALFFLVLLSSCAAQVKLKTPSVGQISPEALGGLGKFELGAGTMGTPAIEVTPDAASIAPDQSTPKVIRDMRSLHVQGGIGILRFMDLIYDPGSYANLKLQLIGSPFAEAKAGNISLSLIGGFGWKDESGRGSDLSLTKSKGIDIAPNIRYTMKASEWKAGALAGYRLMNRFLLYLGGHYYENRYEGNFDNVSGRDGRYSGFSRARSANLGIELSFGTSFVFRLEDAYTVTEIPSASARSSGHFGGIYLAGLIR